jgi:hypothetical protein
MARKAKPLLLCLLLAVGAAQAGVRMYDVDVYKNLNAKVAGDQYHGIYQTFANLVDSVFPYAEFFVGAANHSGQYQFDILSPDGAPIYTGKANAGDSIHYRWVHADLQPLGSTPLIKGATYTLHITQTAPNESINFYYSDQDPYKYGAAGWTDTSHTWYLGNDLCCRIEGSNKTISPEYFGLSGWSALLLASEYAQHDTAEMLLGDMQQAGVKWWRDVISCANTLQNKDVSGIFWKNSDSVLCLAAEHGMHVLPFDGGAPVWASTHHDMHVDTVWVPTLGSSGYWKVETTYTWTEGIPGT